MTDEYRRPDVRRRRSALWAVLVAFFIAAGGVAVVVQPALAQSWWPFGGDDDDDDRPPVPREPVRRPESIPAPIPGDAWQPGGQGATNWQRKDPICLQLEQRLVQEGQSGDQLRARLPQIEAEINKVDSAFNAASDRLDKRCYEYFLFTKSFRNTSQCKALARQVEESKRQLADLESQRQQALGSSGRSYRDEIVRELARNNCGANYADEARRRASGFWNDEQAIGENNWTPLGTSGATTYRTLCVRLCDGYYFPVSFSTLPSHFAEDAEKCSSKCTAPSELYYYPNPGGTVDQSVALKTQEAYTSLKEAFRYRKEYVKGCSCKAAEYVPGSGDKKADASAASPIARSSVFPADAASKAAGSGGLTTGSTAQQLGTPPAAATPPAPAPDADAGGWSTQVE